MPSNNLFPVKHICPHGQAVRKAIKKYIPPPAYMAAVVLNPTPRQHVPSSSAVFSEAGAVVRSEVVPRIIGFNLGILSAEDVEALASKVVTEHAVYAKNLPRLNGPNDPALGPSDRRVRCALCKNSWFRCPGHLGVVHLPVPCYHIGFIDYVYKLLQAVCWNCSSPLGDVDDVRRTKHEHSRGIVRFTQMVIIGRGRFKCRECDVPQPKYSKSGVTISRTWNPKKLESVDALSAALGASARRLFTATDALDILRNIPHDAIRLMGMDPQKSHPASMILQNMAVLPPNARPAIMASEGSKRRGQDDITNQTQDIIKTCKALRRAIACMPQTVNAAVYSSVLSRHESASGNAGSASTPVAVPSASASASGSTSASASVSAVTGTGKARPVAKGRTGAAGRREGRCAASNAHAHAGGAGDPSTTQVAAMAGDCSGLVEHNVSVDGSTDVNALAFVDVEVQALRFTGSKAYCEITPEQASAIATAHPALVEKLQNDVAVLIDNGGRAAPQSQQRSGAPKRDMMDRFTGKTGQIRGAAVAKRSDQNARSVIAPDNKLDVDELGVPDSFMNTLTIPEEVNARNLSVMADCVRRGPGVALGASRILHTSGDLTQLSLVACRDDVAAALQCGDIVERHLRNGDRGCFNRQPSLHRLSFMAHRLVRVPGLAFRVPLGVVGPYNADFDGDEMNLHILQSTNANAEAAELIAVSRNVMNPQNNTPCLSIVQDARVGGMLLTARSTLLDVDVMHQCVGVIKYRLPGKTGMPAPDRYVNGKPMWTGKQLVTLLLPPIFIRRRVRGAGPTVTPDDALERFVVITNGVLEAGTLCKAMLGTGAGSIIHHITKDHGNVAVVRFISDFQRVLYEWLPTRGLTMGLRDCMVAPHVRDTIRRCTDDADATVARITREAHELETVMTDTERAHVEAHVLTILTSVLDYTSRLVLAATHGDASMEAEGPYGFRAMVASASKGNTNNMAQIMACLGQQVIEGQRIQPTTQSRRTLPMFAPGAFSAAARGFVARDYLDGMDPHEYFYHMMGGREGLVATAVKTAETGYKYRSMTKGMETNVVAWDFTVRNAQDYIIEFIVGGDGMDPTQVERVDVPALLYADDVLRASCGTAIAYADRLLRLRGLLRASVMTPLHNDVNTKLLMPVNVAELLARCQHDATTAASARRLTFATDTTSSSDNELAAAVLEAVAAIAAVMPSREAMAALEFSLMYECRPEALRGFGINAAAFRHTVANEIFQRTHAALTHPGESVGVLAGQSIGEPATQFTLNVFHSAGLMQRLMTVGVPRLKELLHASKVIRTPAMVVPFRKPEASTPAGLDRLAASLQFLCIDSVLHSSYPQYDPPGDGVAVPLTITYKDHDLLHHVVTMFGPETGRCLSPWVLRLVLNRAVLTVHGYTPERVARAVAAQLPAYNLSIIYSQPNMPQWVLRVRIDGDATEAACRKLHADLREGVLLGGIDGIRQSRVITVNRATEDAVTGAVTTAPVRVIDTEGSGLMKVATRDWACWEDTITNDVQEVVATLGLAAGRALLFSELERVISYDGGYVDARHIRMVVNTMSHRGYLMPYTRHGINRVDYSVIQRASYEEPVDMLFSGAVTADKDDMHGLCECVLFGVKPPIGTGTVAVQQDFSETTADARHVSRHRPVVSSREADLLRGARKRFREDVSTDTGRRQRPLTQEQAQLWKAPAPVLVLDAAPVTWKDVVITDAFGLQMFIEDEATFQQKLDASPATDASLDVQVVPFRPSSPPRVRTGANATPVATSAACITTPR